MKDYSEEINRIMGSSMDYPLEINDQAGLGYKDEKYFTRARTRMRQGEGVSRRVTVEITSYRGISSDAVHYYGSLKADGVDFIYNDNPNISTTPWDIIKTNPLYGFVYDFELKRPVTEKEAKEGENDKYSRWHGYDLGMYTNAFNTRQDVIDCAVKCFKQRFVGNWELWVDDYTRSSGTNYKVDL